MSIHGYPLIFVAGNLLFAALPALIARTLYRVWSDRDWSEAPPAAKCGLLFGLALWLALLPHAPYLLTLVRHLSDAPSPSVPATLFFIGYGLVGLVAFDMAVRPVRALLMRLAAPRLNPILLGLPVVAVGLLLGWEARLNSWQLLTSPVALISSVGRYCRDDLRLSDLLWTVVFLYAVYGLTTRFKSYPNS